MAEHVHFADHHHHHHHAGSVHPPAAPRASFLRLSASQRLAVAAAVTALLWAAAFWAVRWQP